MSAPSALWRGRRFARSLMTSRCAIKRPSGGTTTGADGNEVDEWTVVHADLPCRIAGSDRAGSYRTARVGDSEVQVAVRVAHLPALTPNLVDGDWLEVTAGETVGAVFRLVETSPKDHETARRVVAVEVDRPEEWA